MKTARPIAAVGICVKVAGFAVALTLSGSSFEGGNFDRCLPQPERQFSTHKTVEPRARSKATSPKRAPTPANTCSSPSKLYHRRDLTWFLLVILAANRRVLFVRG